MFNPQSILAMNQLLSDTSVLEFRPGFSPCRYLASWSKHWSPDLPSPEIHGRSRKHAWKNCHAAHVPNAASHNLPCPADRLLRSVPDPYGLNVMQTSSEPCEVDRVAIGHPHVVDLRLATPYCNVDGRRRQVSRSRPYPRRLQPIRRTQVHDLVTEPIVHLDQASLRKLNEWYRLRPPQQKEELLSQALVDRTFGGNTCSSQILLASLKRVNSSPDLMQSKNPSLAQVRWLSSVEIPGDRTENAVHFRGAKKPSDRGWSPSKEVFALVDGQLSIVGRSLAIAELRGFAAPFGLGDRSMKTRQPVSLMGVPSTDRTTGHFRTCNEALRTTVLPPIKLNQKARPEKDSLSDVILSDRNTDQFQLYPSKPTFLTEESEVTPGEGSAFRTHRSYPTGWDHNTERVLPSQNLVDASDHPYGRDPCERTTIVHANRLTSKGSPAQLEADPSSCSPVLKPRGRYSSLSYGSTYSPVPVCDQEPNSTLIGPSAGHYPKVGVRLPEILACKVSSSTRVSESEAIGPKVNDILTVGDVVDLRGVPIGPIKLEPRLESNIDVTRTTVANSGDTSLNQADTLLNPALPARASNPLYTHPQNSDQQVTTSETSVDDSWSFSAPADSTRHISVVNNGTPSEYASDEDYLGDASVVLHVFPSDASGHEAEIVTVSDDEGQEPQSPHAFYRRLTSSSSLYVDLSPNLRDDEPVDSPFWKDSSGSTLTDASSDTGTHGRFSAVQDDHFNTKSRQKTRTRSLINSMDMKSRSRSSSLYEPLKLYNIELTSDFVLSAPSSSSKQGTIYTQSTLLDQSMCVPLTKEPEDPDALIDIISADASETKVNRPDRSTGPFSIDASETKVNKPDRSTSPFSIDASETKVNRPDRSTSPFSIDASETKVNKPDRCRSPISIDASETKVNKPDRSTSPISIDASETKVNKPDRSTSPISIDASDTKVNKPDRSMNPISADALETTDCTEHGREGTQSPLVAKPRVFSSQSLASTLEVPKRSSASETTVSFKDGRLASVDGDSRKDCSEPPPAHAQLRCTSQVATMTLELGSLQQAQKIPDLDPNVQHSSQRYNLADLAETCLDLLNYKAKNVSIEVLGRPGSGKDFADDLRAARLLFDPDAETLLGAEVLNELDQSRPRGSQSRHNVCSRPPTSQSEPSRDLLTSSSRSSQEAEASSPRELVNSQGPSCTRPSSKQTVAGYQSSEDVVVPENRAPHREVTPEGDSDDTSEDRPTTGSVYGGSSQPLDPVPDGSATSIVVPNSQARSSADLEGRSLEEEAANNSTGIQPIDHQEDRSAEAAREGHRFSLNYYKGSNLAEPDMNFMKNFSSDPDLQDDNGTEADNILKKFETEWWNEEEERNRKRRALKGGQSFPERGLEQPQRKPSKVFKRTTVLHDPAKGRLSLADLEGTGNENHTLGQKGTSTEHLQHHRTPQSQTNLEIRAAPEGQEAPLSWEEARVVLDATYTMAENRESRLEDIKSEQKRLLTSALSSRARRNNDEDFLWLRQNISRAFVYSYFDVMSQLGDDA